MMSSTLVWLFDATLKGSVLILAVALIQWLIGARVDARWRHLLWIVVLVRLLVPFSPSSSLSLFNAMPSRERASVLRMPIEPPLAAAIPGTRTMLLRTEDPRSTPWRVIFAIWLLGALVVGTRTLVAAVRMHLRVRSIGARGRFGALNVIETDIVRTPALYGLLRPRLLLPPGLTQDEIRHVVLHESWHLKRMDVAVSWLVAAAQIVHWFNPLMWFAASRIKEERELSCDELALSLLEEEERPHYGRTILTLLQRFASAAPVPALVGIVNDKEKMKRRITMIATFRNRPRFTMLFLILVTAFGIAGLTDAKGGDRMRVLRKLDPAVQATVERLDKRVSFELTSASLSDLITTISNKTGVPVVVSKEVAAHDVQKARFTIKAENVPSHAVLTEALMAFELSAEPGAEVVTIVDRPNELMITKGGALEIEEDHAVNSEDRVFVRKIKEKKQTIGGEGDKLRREMTIDLDVNGEKSTGKLTIDIVR